MVMSVYEGQLLDQSKGARLQQTHMHISVILCQLIMAFLIKITLWEFVFQSSHGSNKLNKLICADMDIYKAKTQLSSSSPTWFSVIQLEENGMSNAVTILWPSFI